jgi:phosphopantetheinyl transferase (holo-ACP synthase)
VISAGNDIVALKAVDEQRTSLPAFYKKFITEAELGLYQHSVLPFSAFVWLLWSVKESAYKYLKRGDADLVFSPAKIIVEQLTLTEQTSDDHFLCDIAIKKSFSGVVTKNQSSLYFKSVINADFIATTIAGNRLYWGVRYIDQADYQTQSAAVRLFALEALSNIITSDNLWIDKHPVAGYPILLHGQSQVDIPLTFAHHDRYVSYAFQIPK